MYIYVSVSVCICVCLWICTCVQTPEEVVQSPGAGITESIEPFDVSAGNQNSGLLARAICTLNG